MTALEAFRGLFGLCQLVWPRLLFRAVTGVPPSQGAVVVMRVLGARHLIQALLLARAARSWHRCGALVDLAHAATMVAAAIGNRHWRKPAGIDAALASALAVAEAR